MWVPAHTTEKDVGVKGLGNGQKLTTLDRRGNELADKPAKAGAETHRAPQAIRDKLCAQDELIERTVTWIGKANWEAKTILRPPSATRRPQLVKPERPSRKEPRQLKFEKGRG